MRGFALWLPEINRADPDFRPHDVCERVCNQAWMPGMEVLRFVPSRRQESEITRPPTTYAAFFFGILIGFASTAATAIVFASPLARSIGFFFCFPFLLTFLS